MRLKSKKSLWMVNCKACGRPFPTPLDRETLEEVAPLNSYQCPSCGLTEQYSKDDHSAANA